MGRQHTIDKTIRPLTTITNITPAGVITNVASAGVLPIGNYKGVPAFWDLDKAVNQPLIWAEKQWTIDKVDERDGPAGVQAQVTLPIGAVDGTHVVGVAPGGIITVPAGQVWYLQSYRFTILQSAALAGPTGVRCTFRVSPWPKVAVTGVDKEYHAAAAFAIGVPGALTAAIAAADVNIGPINFTTTAGEMGQALRLVGGDILTVVAWPYGGAVAGQLVQVNLAVYGWKAKLLVA